MRISLGDVTLWFDVSGPSVVPRGDTAIELPALVAVHGGPGLDHVNLKAELAPLARHVQVLYYDQRGHGRSDYSTPEFWNLRTWADDLRRLCDTLGVVKPVVLGSSFGGHVVLAYAGLYPGHPGGIALANTTGDAPIISAVPRYSAGWAATKQPPSPSAISPIRPKNPWLITAACVIRSTAASPAMLKRSGSGVPGRSRPRGQPALLPQ